MIDIRSFIESKRPTPLLVRLLFYHGVDVLWSMLLSSKAETLSYNLYISFGVLVSLFISNLKRCQPKSYTIWISHNFWKPLNVAAGEKTEARKSATEYIVVSPKKERKKKFVVSLSFWFLKN